MDSGAIRSPAAEADRAPARLVVDGHGQNLLARPLLNNCSAFTADERDAFGLHGLLPPGVATIDEQVRLELEHVRRKTDDIFPGLGLGAIVAKPREVTDDMFLVAAHQLADLVSAERLRTGALYPPVAELRAVARAVAIAVTRKARDDGRGLALSDPEIEATVDRAMWWPDYVPFEPGH